MADGTSGYDAFISYSHTLDGALARALQTGLERFAKPWYRPRALRVFRDTTNLAANPDLWSSIETALASSTWLVLMASPNAAQSKWVNREVAWWMENKSPQRLLVVLTEGEFALDEDAGHGDGATAALPPALRGAFGEEQEPRWVDLRWLHDVNQVDQSNPSLRECVADVAAAVREVPKDTLIGEHIVQHRRTLRLVQGAVTTLAVLLVAAVVAALVAVNQRNQAQTQRDRAVFNQIIAQADRVRPDGRTLASGSADQTVRLWDVAEPADPTSLDQPLTGHASAVFSVAFSPDGHTLATGSADQTVRLWSVPPTLLVGHTSAVDQVAFSPDGHTLATSSLDRTVRLWNVTDPALPIPLGEPLTGHTKSVNAVVFSSDGRTLATGGDQTVRLWNVADPAHPIPLGEPLTGHTDYVYSVAFSPDGRTLASGSLDRTVRLWNVTDPALPIPRGEPLTGHIDSVNAVVFSPDGRTLATGGDQTIRLWNVADTAHLILLGRPLTGHIDQVTAVVFSPDGRTLATGSTDHTVRLWNVTDPADPMPLGRPLTGHINTVHTVVFSPDGRTLASGGTDRTVRLWNVTDPTDPVPLGRPLTGHTNGISSVVFSPDGHTLASGSRDQTTWLWGMNVDQAIQRICAGTRNTLTPEKWVQYVSPDLPYRPPCR